MTRERLAFMGRSQRGKAVLLHEIMQPGGIGFEETRGNVHVEATIKVDSGTAVIAEKFIGALTAAVVPAAMRGLGDLR